MTNDDLEEEIIVTDASVKKGTNIPNLVYAINKDNNPSNMSDCDEELEKSEIESDDGNNSYSKLGQ